MLRSRYPRPQPIRRRSQGGQAFFDGSPVTPLFSESTVQIRSEMMDFFDEALYKHHPGCVPDLPDMDGYNE